MRLYLSKLASLVQKLNWTRQVFLKLQSTLVISASLISNNRLSRSQNLVPVLTWVDNSRWQNIVEKMRNFMRVIDEAV